MRVEGVDSSRSLLLLNKKEATSHEGSCLSLPPLFLVIGKLLKIKDNKVPLYFLNKMDIFCFRVYFKRNREMEKWIELDSDYEGDRDAYTAEGIF
jgi:hypothetical protein